MRGFSVTGEQEEIPPQIGTPEWLETGPPDSSSQPVSLAWVATDQPIRGPFLAACVWRERL